MMSLHKKTSTKYTCKPLGWIESYVINARSMVREFATKNPTWNDAVVDTGYVKCPRSIGMGKMHAHKKTADPNELGRPLRFSGQLRM